jgi:hypothetical protein
VVAAICPWNFPLAVLCRKLGPALVTGNTVVVKPSEVSPLSTIELFRLIDAELDLPPGVQPRHRRRPDRPMTACAGATGTSRRSCATCGRT